MRLLLLIATIISYPSLFFGTIVYSSHNIDTFGKRLDGRIDTAVKIMLDGFKRQGHRFNEMEECLDRIEQGS